MYEGPEIATIIKFSISNGHMHIEKDILFEFSKCTTSDYDTHNYSVTSETNDSECLYLGYHTTGTTSCNTDHSQVSRKRIKYLN